MTVFTPAYQREATMPRLYESLLRNKEVCGGDLFEWVIVNDGSTDGTEELVRRWCDEDRLPIRYFYQENRGKHIATNFAVSVSESEVFLTMDSDDVMLPDAVVSFYQEWQTIPDKENYKGVVLRCIDDLTGEITGRPLPVSPLDVYTPDLRFKYHISGENFGFTRTDLMRAFPFPELTSDTRFCPENIVWFEIGKKYLERVVDRPGRIYFHDTDNALTAKSHNRASANYYWWLYGVNNLLKYFIYDPKQIMAFLVGISRDGLIIGKKPHQILNDVRGWYRKCLVLLLMPAGWILSVR